MPKEYKRIQRIEKEMQKVIAIILQREIKDPRVGIATVSGIKVSHDLTYATVFVTFLNINMNKKTNIALRVLQTAAGFIRNLLGKTMRIRVLPELTFTYDQSLIEGIRMSDLLTRVIKNDY